MVNAILKFLDNHHTFLIETLEGIASFVAPEAAPGIIIGGESINHRWDQADRIAAEATATLDQAKATYAEGSRSMQDIKRKVALINSTVSQHKKHNMSLLDDMHGASGPSPMNVSNQYVETIHADRPDNVYDAKRKKSTRYKLQNQLFTQMGAAVLSQSGAATLASTKMVVGKRQYHDPVPSFLGNLSGSGVVTNEWSGIVKGALNTRLSFCTFFRHCMSDYDASNAANGFTVSIPYSNTLRPYVLIPSAAADIAIAGTAGSVTTGSTYLHTDKEEYWAPLNRADYEDMSWNLNKLKLGPDNIKWTGAGVVPVDSGADIEDQFNANHSLMRVNEHRRISNIMINNCLPGTATPAYPTPPGAGVGVSTPYKYNMVFNYGTVDYSFSNKGSHSSIVEVVVYRVKKGRNLPVYNMTPATNPDPAVVDPGVAYTNIYAPICEGYMATKADKFGTDDLQGRPPTVHDVLDNPKYPFLPELKKTIQGDLPVTEVMRKQFVLPSGGRKKVMVNLPGAIYDPANIVAKKGLPSPPSGTTGLHAPNEYPQVDDHSYAIVIAVNGTIQSRNLHRDNTFANSGVGSSVQIANAVDVPFLDLFGEYDVQYYASYSEHIGACQYKTPSKKTIYVRGAAMDLVFSGDSLVQSEAVVVVPATQVMRSPSTVSKTTSVRTGPNAAGQMTTATQTQTNQGNSGGSFA